MGRFSQLHNLFLLLSITVCLKVTLATVQTSPTKVQGKLNQGVVLTCTETTPNPTSASIHWTFNNNILACSDKYIFITTTTTTSVTSTLIIKSLTASDVGNYYCAGRQGQATAQVYLNGGGKENGSGGHGGHGGRGGGRGRGGHGGRGGRRGGRGRGGRRGGRGRGGSRGGGRGGSRRGGRGGSRGGRGRGGRRGGRGRGGRRG